jgi:hypothetical protein
MARIFRRRSFSFSFILFRRLLLRKVTLGYCFCTLARFLEADRPVMFECFIYYPK